MWTMSAVTSIATTEVVTRIGIIQCAQLRWVGCSGGGIGSAEVVSAGLGTDGGLFVATIGAGSAADSLPNLMTIVFANGDTRYSVGAARSITTRVIGGFALSSPTRTSLNFPRLIATFCN